MAAGPDTGQCHRASPRPYILVLSRSAHDNRGLLLCHPQLMELNEKTVLAAVNDLHARTGKRVFTLIEIAEALSDGQRVTPPGRHGPDSTPTATSSPSCPRRSRPGSRCSTSILLHLGEEGKLPVMQTAMVVFPPE